MLLVGKNALVTGSSQGVGRSIAVALARAGANVVVHGLHRDKSLEESLSMCRDAAEKRDSICDAIVGDLSGPTAECTRSLFEQAIEANSNIDILVNNAGTYDDVPFLEMDVDRFERTMRLNVASYFFLSQAFAKHWVREKSEGRILMIGSINGRLAEPTHSAYDTSKGAVEMMVKTLCVELAPYGIRVNGLAPGLFVTPLTQNALSDARAMDWMKLHTPNHSVPGPEVAGDAAAFLVSDAACHITGQMLLVDGGMSAWQQPDMP